LADPVLLTVLFCPFYGVTPSGTFSAGDERAKLWHRVLVAGVLSIEIKGDFDRIVEHSVDQLAGRDVALEAQKFLVPVALDALTDRHPIEQVERRKQSGCAMANIIVGHRPGAPALHRQARLGAVERLGLALFVEREHRCAPANRAKYDHIAQFGGKLRVAALKL
jgi:hypothetical protein